MNNTFFRGLVLFALMTITLTVVAQDGEGGEVPRTGFRPDAPTYGIRGEYPVGTIDMMIEDEERPLPVTIWYPALNLDGLPEVHNYPVMYPPVLPPLEVFGAALFEAEPDAENGPYPLVIFSHGFTTFRTQNSFFAEHLASWGFVVMAPDHIDMTVDNFGKDPATFYPMYYNTPQDVSRTIDFAESINADGMMAGMIDMEHIAAAGHSSGGFTALQAVGGQLDLAGLLELCEEREGASFDCPHAVPEAEALAALYGLDGVPDDLLPAIGDDRIDAIIPLAPDQIFFGETGLNNVTVPTLYMVGNQDEYIPFDEFETGFSSLGSEIAYMVEFDYGGHGMFQDTCERYPALVSFGLYSLCGEVVWDKLRAHDITNHYATSFLLWQLTDDEAAAATFGDTPETFPGVEVIMP